MNDLGIFEVKDRPAHGPQSDHWCSGADRRQQEGGVGWLRV